MLAANRFSNLQNIIIIKKDTSHSNGHLHNKHDHALHSSPQTPRTDPCIESIQSFGLVYATESLIDAGIIGRQSFLLFWGWLRLWSDVDAINPDYFGRTNRSGFCCWC